jgi:16S rRNA (adenine1518-N6/adenine1519-N6)-dimethyltransferase
VATNSRLGARPKRSLGQNFLVDKSFRDRIVSAARVERGGVVLEIGPGEGALTWGLLERVEKADGRLVLVELDDALAARLADELGGRPRATVLNRSILEVPLTSVTEAPERLSVVGNIPYNLTSPILFHLLAPPRPLEILVMVQREVADRILAEPGTRTYGALSVGVQAVATAERVMAVPAGAFRPAPKVSSAVVRIVPTVPPSLTPAEEGELRRFTRALFQWRRKQLGKILRDHPDLVLSSASAERVLAAGGARPEDRPETVGPDGFLAMARALGRLGD